jgi:hypothetical protein
MYCAELLASGSAVQWSVILSELSHEAFRGMTAALSAS